MIPLVYMSIAFGFSELILMFIKRSDKRSAKIREDKGSMILIWLAILAGFFSGFYFSKPGRDFYYTFGFVIIIYGLILRWVAILQLGKSFTVDVAITSIATLKTDGIYRRVRHPSYSGLILVIAGFGLTMSSLCSFLLLFIPVFAAIIYRISVEEKVLTSEFGEKYLKYMRHTKRIIPGIY